MVDSGAKAREDDAVEVEVPVPRGVGGGSEIGGRVRVEPRDVGLHVPLKLGDSARPAVRDPVVPTLVGHVEGGARDVVGGRRRRRHHAREAVEDQTELRLDTLDELEVADDALRPHLLRRHKGSDVTHILTGTSEIGHIHWDESIHSLE